MEITPGIFELDEYGEANGVVRLYCSDACRDIAPHADTDLDAGAEITADGLRCESCGKELD